VADGRGLEALDAEQASALVEGSRDVEIEVRINAAQPSFQSGHRHHFLGRLGRHRA
jgi:hypothetical protein